MKPLTPRQAEILTYLAKRWANPPTIREIGAEFGINSPHGVCCHLKPLQKKGYIEWEPGLARAIRVLVGPSLDGDTIEIMGRTYTLKEETDVDSEPEGRSGNRNRRANSGHGHRHSRRQGPTRN